MGRLIDFKRLVVGAAFVLGVSLSVQGNCLHEGSLVWCQWGGANPGCFSVNNLYEPNVGADCADLVGNCLENGLGMFSGVNSSHSSMLGPGWGAGANCEIAGGTQVGGTQGTGMFCNYGACVGSASGGDGCVDGGCYPQKIGEACTGGSVVSICPCANLPPNAVAANAPCDGGDTGGGTGELCRDPQNRQLYCQWGTGCYSVNTLHGDNAGKTCEQVIAECEADGALFHSVDPSVFTTANNHGDGVSCVDNGGVQIGGNTFTGKFCNYGACVNGVGDNCQTGGCYPERVGEGCSGGSVVDLCPCANLPPNQIAAGAACDDGDTGGGTGELCRDPQNRQLYCQWGTGCYSVNTLHGDNAGKTCEQVIDECNTVGFGVYHSVNPSVLNAGNNFGDDIVCGAAGGVKVDATGALRSCGRRAAAPISAFYTKGSVSVNWNAASKISSGTISLVNIKGAAVASASIKANSSSISRKLGSKLPAGMYFVRVDARDVNGKRIVLQVPVQIVK